MSLPRLPHEVREAQVVGFPAIKFEVAIGYNVEDDEYDVFVRDLDGGKLYIGSFPTDVAHMLLDPLCDL